MRPAGVMEEIGRSIFEAALDCIVTMDADGRVLDMNPAAEATFGYARDEARGRPVADLIIPAPLRPAHAAALARYLATGEKSILDRRLELEAMRADGSTLPVELTVTRLGVDEPPAFAGFVRDITARRRADAEIARLLERESRARRTAEAAEQAARRVSGALQSNLLPPHLPSIPEIELAAAYEAAPGETVVGGDFYDFFPLGGGRWGVVIGDVSGKGADAAALTALVRYTIRASLVGDTDPRTALAAVNEALRREPRSNAYCTLVLGVLVAQDGGSALRLTVAGHPPPLLIDAEGRSSEVSAPGTMLGACAEPRFGEADVRLDDGSTLLLFTDGVTETRTPEGLLGVEGLQRVVAAIGDRRPSALVPAVADAVRRGEGHVVGDDVAILALSAARRAPATAA